MIRRFELNPTHVSTSAERVCLRRLLLGRGIIGDGDPGRRPCSWNSHGLALGYPNLSLLGRRTKATVAFVVLFESSCFVSVLWSGAFRLPLCCNFDAPRPVESWSEVAVVGWNLVNRIRPSDNG